MTSRRRLRLSGKPIFIDRGNVNVMSAKEMKRLKLQTGANFSECRITLKQTT